ncbi:MAG: hypothetical protein IJL12_01195 [Selenomonadaceae bacterium]|nr:hypothetical protein [Selenomonadaceae bacterium]
MQSFFVISFVISLIALVYFLLRFTILLLSKQDTASYKKKLIVSTAILAVSLVVIGTIPKSSEQIAAKREKFGIEAPKEDGTLYEQRHDKEKINEQKTAAPKELTPEEKAAKEAEQKAAEEKRLAEQKAAEEKKVQEEAERGVRQRELIEAEKYAFQDWKAKLYSGSDAVDEHWENLWQYTLTSASNGYMDAQTVFQNLRELEHNLIEDEMIFHNATIPEEMSEVHAKKMNTIKKGLADWARLRRKGCEHFRLAFASGDITPQVMQESLDIIKQSDAVLLNSTAKLIALEEEINNL